MLYFHYLLSVLVIRVGELQIRFQEVAFLPSLNSFETTFFVINSGRG